MSASDLKINLKHLNSAEFSMCNLPINLLWFQEIWEDICTLYMSITQGPHSQILIMGGPTEVHILYKKKITTSEFVYPKKSLLFFSIPQKNPLVLFSQPKKIPLFSFATQKHPGIIHRAKKFTFGQNFRPKKITRIPHH